MIPTKATPELFETLVSNIVAAWHAATPEQVSKGRAWYPVAHDLAVMLGNGDARMGAGIIAALSVQKSWSENIRLANDAATGNVHGHTGANLRKVAAILAGTDPANVLPMAAKTGNFYLNILDPCDPTAVTVDRHAYDVAVNEVNGSKDRGLGNANRYATVKAAYIEAARRIGELPPVVQAGVWQARIEMLARTRIVNG